MALPANYDIKEYLPKEEDFEAVFNAKKNGNYHNLPYYPLGKDEPYYYPTVRIYLAAILLKWEELGKLTEKWLLEGKYMTINGVRQLVPYYTPKDLAIIRSFAAQYKQYYISGYMKYRDAGQSLTSPEKLTQQARDARKGEIEVKSNGQGFYHLVIYSMKYGNDDPNKAQSGAKMHLFFGKDIGGKYSIVVRGSNLYGAGKDKILDAPYFETEQEARNFIANVDHNHLDTKVTIEDFRYVISNQRIQDGRKEIGRRIENGVDYGPEWGPNYIFINAKDVVKVDTVCGPAYMLKNCDLLK